MQSSTEHPRLECRQVMGGYSSSHNKVKVFHARMYNLFFLALEFPGSKASIVRKQRRPNLKRCHVQIPGLQCCIKFWWKIERKLLLPLLFCWCMSLWARGIPQSLRLLLEERVFSINLPNIFSSPRLSVVTRNCLRVAGRPVALSKSFIFAWLSWVSVRLEYRSCCVVTQRLSFSSPKLAKQLHLQQIVCRIKKEVFFLSGFFSIEKH